MGPIPPKRSENRGERDKGRAKPDTKPDGVRKVKLEKPNQEDIKRQKDVLIKQLGEVTEEHERKVLENKIEALNKMEEDEIGWNPGGGTEVVNDAQLSGAAGLLPNAQLTSDTNAQLPSDVNAQLPSNTNAQLPSNTNAQLPSNTNAQLPSNTNAQLPSNTNAQLTGDAGAQPSGANAQPDDEASNSGAGDASNNFNSASAARFDANGLATSIEATTIEGETFLGHDIVNTGAIQYKQLSGTSPPTRLPSEFAKPMGHHVNKKLMLIAYGPPNARTWRLEDERTWIVNGKVTIISDRHNRYAHVAYPYQYKGLVGVSIEANEGFSIEQLNPDRRKKNGQDTYPFVMLACRWINDVVTHEIRSDWVKVKSAKQPLKEIYETARVQERAYSEWWAMLPATVQSTVINPLPVRGTRSNKPTAGRYETVTPDRDGEPRHRYRTGSPEDRPRQRREQQRYPRSRRYSASTGSDTESDEDGRSDSDEMPEVTREDYVEYWCDMKGREATPTTKAGEGRDGKKAYKAYAALYGKGS